MTAVADSPLSEHRAPVLEYLRRISLPGHSVAGEIIDERRPPDAERELLRATLVLWACDACHGDGQDALPVAAAFELFDQFMRLHDELIDTTSPDVPDGISVARWGLGQALNAGDALYALALQTLAIDAMDPDRRLVVASFVARAVLAAIEARNDDISLRHRDAVLTGAALRAGAMLAGASAAVQRRFDRCGRLLYVASTLGDRERSARIFERARQYVAGRC